MVLNSSGQSGQAHSCIRPSLIGTSKSSSSALVFQMCSAFGFRRCSMGVSLLYVIGSRSGAVNRMGSENEVEQSLERSRTVTDGAELGRMRTHLVPRPHGGILRQSGSYLGFRILLLLDSRCQAATSSTPSRFQRNSVPSIHPYAVHDDAEPAGERNLRARLAPALRHTHRPGFQPRPPRRAPEQGVSGFVERRTHHRVAAPGDSSRSVDLSGLPLARRKPEVRAHRARAPKTRWHVDARQEGERRHRTHAGDRHQATADRVDAYRRVSDILCK